ncbi:MAG TPA: HEPN domain-containing protein [Allosphingosinicella sp.]|jgi:hypothetical protein
MPTEFDAIFDEFSEELDSLAEMAGDRGTSSGAAGLTPRARVAAANAAVLLLAAVFEEHVRQQVRAAFREKTRSARALSDFPHKIAAVVWKRSLEGLARTPFEEIETNVRSADEQVAATLAFCLRKEVAANVEHALSHNENNMRPGELNRLFNQIGLKSIITECCKQPRLKAFLGKDTFGTAQIELEARLEAFFRRRNSTAHAIQFGSSSGPTELLQDIEMFRALGQALAVTIALLLAPRPRERGRRVRPAEATDTAA